MTTSNMFASNMLFDRPANVMTTNKPTCKSEIQENSKFQSTKGNFIFPRNFCQVLSKSLSILESPQITVSSLPFEILGL